MSDTPTLLFEYLRQILYEPQKASLDISLLDEPYRKLGQGLTFLHNCLVELNELSSALAKGNLSVDLPPASNPLVAQLKALNASLKHLTWTSQQVAKGDYQQRIDFMGEFAEAFNTMTIQLEQRQKALELEIEQSQRKTLALEQSYSLLDAATNGMQQWVLILDLHSGSTLFQNQSLQTALEADSKLKGALWAQMGNYLKNSLTEMEEWEFELRSSTDNLIHYYRGSAYPMSWQETQAIAYVINDVTNEKRHAKRLENVAYQDTLTNTSNRYHGMQQLGEWLHEGREFFVCFVDLDNLKFVNDHFGHSEGDQYIINAANLLKEHLPEAMVCRLGGDEFMLLVPNTNQADITTRLEDIRNTMINSGTARGLQYMCSLSYGTVEVPKNNTKTSGELLSIADERMYEYKRNHKKGRGERLE